MITSVHNPKLRLVRRLLESRRQREKEGLFVCEGEDLVAAADAAGVEPFELLRGGEDVEPELLAAVSTLAHPPRVIGIYARDALPRGVAPLCVALWHVRDAGNVGTLLRSADAFGASLALSSGSADVTNPRCVRASMGAIFRVPTARFEEAPRPWIALAPHAAMPVADVARPDATYAVGAERDGLPEEVVNRCDAVATIPITGDAESLNVAMAGTIALYEATKITSSPPA